MADYIGKKISDLPVAESIYDTDLLLIQQGETTKSIQKQNLITDVIWGNITGTLSNQTDLSTALSTKLDNTGISNPQDGQKLVYDGSSNKWINKTANDGVWGSISGNIEDQTDLQDALDLKADKSDVAPLYDTTGQSTIGAMTQKAVTDALNNMSDEIKQYINLKYTVE